MQPEFGIVMSHAPGISQFWEQMPAGRRAPHPVQGVAITDQDAQCALGRGRRDFHRNLPQDALPAIRTQQGFDGDVVAGTGFRHVGAGGLKAR